MRAVLVEWSEADWRLFRQERWMGAVRAHPEAAGRPKRYFDLDDDAFARCLGGWNQSAAGVSLESALERLREHAARRVRTPSP